MIGIRECISIFARSLTLFAQCCIPEYNPRYYKEPEKFKPSRWEGAPNELENLTAFSFGEPCLCYYAREY